MSARDNAQRGSAVVELSFLFMVLLLLLLGIIDFAMMIQKSMVINEAAYAGVQYGAISGNSTDLTGMQTVATNSAKGISGLTVTASKWCACSAGGASVPCSSTCSSYSTPIAYVEVDTSATPAVLFNFVGLPLSIPLKSVCVLRVQ